MDTILLTLSIVSGQLVRLSFGTGGLNLLDITVIILCVLGFIKSKFRLTKPPLWLKASSIFVLVGLISLIFTPVHLGQVELLASAAYLLRFCIYMLLGWLISSDSLPHIRKQIPYILITSSISLAVLGLLQIIFIPNLRFLSQFGWDPHYFRAASTFLDPNFLGSFLVLSLIVLIQNRAIVQKWIIFSFVIIYLCLLVTFSRGAYLALLTSFSLLSLLNKSIKQFILTITLFAFLLLGFHTYQILVAEPKGVNRSQSAEFRLSTWQQGWKLFLKSPILGVGFNSYKFALREYSLADETFLRSHGSTTNDSSLLYVLSTTGIVGLISYLFFLFTLFKTGLKEKILSAGLLGLLAQSFFANTLFYPPILLWIILLAAQKK